jgi:sugar diacid utilization regulator
MTVPDATLRELAVAAGADAGGVDPELLGDFLPALAGSLGSGRAPARALLQRSRARGRDAARQGVALPALLDLYLSAARRLWRELPAADGPAVAAAGDALLHAIDDVVAALAAGYQQARQGLLREEASARREFVDDLLSGRADVAGLLRRASGFGLDLSRPHAVLVLRAERPVADTAPLVPTLERTLGGGAADVLVASKEGALVAVVGAADDAAVRVLAQQVADVLRPVDEHVDLRRRAALGRWRLGVGRAAPGAAGVLASYEQARDALELAERIGSVENVVFARDLLAYQVLLRDRTAITDLIRTLLGPLTEARGGAAPLLETLAAYFAAGSNTARAARALHLSVRAVTYRLQRVRELTGADPAAPRDAFALHAAVLGARLLGWPDTDL